MMIIMTKCRTVSFDVPPQEILTKDSVTVAVDAVVYYKVSDLRGNKIIFDIIIKIFINS